MQLKNVLIVDPETHIQELLSMYLKKNGYTIFTASNSEEAIALLMSKEIDLVILEIVLGYENGLVLLSTIKEVFPDTKVIILTSMGYVEDLMSKAEESGADGYLSKVQPLDELSLSILRIKEGKPRKSQEL